LCKCSIYLVEFCKKKKYNFSHMVAGSEIPQRVRDEWAGLAPLDQESRRLKAEGLRMRGSGHTLQHAGSIVDFKREENIGRLGVKSALRSAYHTGAASVLFYRSLRALGLTPREAIQPFVAGFKEGFNGGRQPVSRPVRTAPTTA
jgi:hypothetical protein